MQNSINTSALSAYRAEYRALFVYIKPDALCIRLSLQKMSVSDACKPSSVEGGHLSRPIVTDGFKRNPESLTGRLKRSFVSCSEWGLHRGQVARPRVSSYLTFPPLHAEACGISLLHFPWGHPRRALPGTLPYGARTFLTPFGARPPGSLTNERIISHFSRVVNAGTPQSTQAAPHQPARRRQGARARYSVAY